MGADCKQDHLVGLQGPEAKSPCLSKFLNLLEYGKTLLYFFLFTPPSQITQLFAQVDFVDQFNRVSSKKMAILGAFPSPNKMHTVLYLNQANWLCV